MITRVDIRTRQGVTLPLPLGDASNGVIVREIEGLDPVKATLVSTSFANMDGEQYHSSRREARNIVLKLKINPVNGSDSVRDIRRRLYDFFMPKSPVTLQFTLSDGVPVQIEGRVESCETPLFVQEPVVDVSIMCFNPDFINPVPIVTQGTSTAGTAAKQIQYDGSVESGVLFVIKPVATVSDFTIYHTPSDGIKRSLYFSGPLFANDELRISTVPGDKYVTLLRNGQTVSALYGMSPQSNWIELHPGLNELLFYAEGTPIPYRVEYTTKYGGL